MKHVANVLRFLVFIPLCLGLLWGMYWCIGEAMALLFRLKTFWIIVILVFAASLIIGLSAFFFGYLASLLSLLNPYKKVGAWIVVPIAVVLAVVNIYYTWKILDLDLTRHIILGIISSGFVLFCTAYFCIMIAVSGGGKTGKLANVLIFALSVSLVLQSCTATKSISDVMNYWVGRDKRELIMSWGPPAKTEHDGNGGTILVYARRVYYNTMGNIVDYYEYKMFYVNKDNWIYHWLYRKNPNAPDRIDVKLL